MDKTVKAARRMKEGAASECIGRLAVAADRWKNTITLGWAKSGCATYWTLTRTVVTSVVRMAWWT